MSRFCTLGLVVVLTLGALTGSLGCTSAGGSILTSALVRPTSISPNGDGRDDAAEITYQVSRPATVSIYLVTAVGQRFDFRTAEPRPAGDYVALFGGVIESPMKAASDLTLKQASLLPDGEYHYFIEARDDAGHTDRVDGTLSIAGGDPSRPDIVDYSVFTPSFNREPPAGSGNRIVFTPNRDGISDRIAVSFRLAKPAWAEVYLVRLGDSKHVRYPISERQWYKLAGTRNFDYEGGVDLGNTPPPNGEYVCIAEATDTIGNHTVAVQPITIADGGVPLAEIVSAKFSPVVLPLGELLKVEITVENVGPVSIRSKGPYSGTTYLNTENFNAKSATNKADFFEEPGVFRVGVDYEGNSEGREYPYRWGIAGDVLKPGERATIVGYIKMVETVKPHNPHFWVGLLHEQVRKVNDKYKPTLITIGF